MFGAEGVLLVVIILIVCASTAVGALTLIIVAVKLWRKRRRKQALWFGVPAILYLSAFSWLFSPRSIPKKNVTLDLSHPTDLSGIPKDTRWFSVPSRFCCVEGFVHVRVILPASEVIDDTSSAVFIDVDEQGITNIQFTSLPVAPATAHTRNTPLLGRLLAQCTNRADVEPSLDDLQHRLATYVPGSDIDYSTRFVVGSWNVFYGAKTTFMPSDQIQYEFLIKRPDPKRPKP